MRERDSADNSDVQSVHVGAEAVDLANLDHCALCRNSVIRRKDGALAGVRTCRQDDNAAASPSKMPCGGSGSGGGGMDALG